MTYFYLLFAGALVSVVHGYLVWHHRDNRRYSVSEHAMLTTRSHLLYFLSHVVCEVFFLLFSYRFLMQEHRLLVPFYLISIFAGLDFVQAALPSRGKTEKMHFAAAYISWLCYLLGGVWSLHVAEPFKILAVALLAPIVGMFFYMHINRSKLYPYQLAIVPLFVVYLLLIAIGASYS